MEGCPARQGFTLVMKHLPALKAVLIAIAFTLFVGAGFVSVNLMTSCESQAQCVACGTPCVGVVGIGAAMTTINALLGSTFFPATVLILSTYMGLALTAFTTTMAQKLLEVQRSLVAWIDTFWWYNLRPAMQAMTDQLNTFDTFQDQQLGAFADVMDAMRVDQELIKRDLDAHREQRPGENVCVAGTVAGGMTRASTFRRSYEAAATAERSPRGANDATVAPTNMSAAQDQQDRWATYLNNYCNAAYNGGYSGCEAMGARPFPDRDIKVTEEIFMKDTIDLKDPPTQQAIDNLLINVAEPLTKDPVPASALESPQGQEQYLRQRAYQTKRQAIFDALYYIVSRRAPGGVDTAAGPTDNLAAFLGPMRTASGMSASYFSENPSHNEIMEVMMSERFRSGQYSIEQIDEPENNAREMVVQQAFQAMLLSDQLDLLDRYGLILAAQTAESIRDTKPLRAQTEFSFTR